MRGEAISMHPSCDVRLQMKPYTSAPSSLADLRGNIFNAYLNRQFYYQSTPEQQPLRGEFTGREKAINVYTDTHSCPA